MAGIVDPIKDILTQLGKITELNFIRVWNNQVERLEKDENYSFLMPAAFIEVISPNSYLPIGEGFSEGDIVFSIHLVAEELDAGDGTMDQNLTIFILRDKVIGVLNRFQATGCSLMYLISEQQDYDHTNVYHYTLDFKCSFIDSKGSPYDPEATTYITKEPPTDLQVDISVAASGDIQGAPFNSLNQPYRIR